MDREKVIKELHDARRYLEDKEWSDRGASPHIDAINDALALLKEQETVVHCGDCENFCFDNISPNAGRCMLTNTSHSKTWFCAHGKREEGR